MCYMAVWRLFAACACDFNSTVFLKISVTANIAITIKIKGKTTK